MGHVSILLDEMGLDKMGLDEMGINQAAGAKAGKLPFKFTVNFVCLFRNANAGMVEPSPT